MYPHTNTSRLAVSALKIDVYLALVSNQPPIMHSEELQLGVPPTFALWNSWGLDKYFRRLQDEPADRSSFSMASMAQSPQTLIPSGALVEDVVTGLCGSYQNIWRLAQVQWSGGFVPQGDSDRAWLSQPLHAWKDRLEGIANLWADPVANAHAIRCLLLSYLGQETPDQPGWEQSVMNRITRFVLNGRMLYHLLLLHLNINVRFMTVLALGSWSIAGVGGGGPSACMPRDDVDLVQLSQWAVSHDARQAILHCLVVLMAYERDMVTVSGASGSVDPITHVTLATAAAIMRGWFLTNAVPCACLAMGAPPAQSMEIDTGAITENRGWVANGGCVTVDGVPICACSSETWMTRFASTLRRHGRGWNLAELVATRLQTSVHVAST